MVDVTPINVQAQQLAAKQQQIQQQQEAFRQEQAKLSEVQSQYMPKVGLTPVNVAYEKQYRTQLAKTQDIQKQLASNVEQYNIGVSEYQSKISEAQKTIEALPTTPKSEKDIQQAQIAYNKGYLSPEDFQSYKDVATKNIKSQQDYENAQKYLSGEKKFPTYIISQHDREYGGISYEVEGTGKEFKTPEAAKQYVTSELKGIPARVGEAVDVEGYTLQLLGLGTAKTPEQISREYWSAKESQQQAMKLAYLESPTAQWGSPEALSKSFEQILGRPATVAELALAQYGKPEIKEAQISKLQASPEGQKEIARAIDLGKVKVEGIKTGAEYLKAVEAKPDERVVLPSTPRATVESFMEKVGKGEPLDLSIRSSKPGEFGYHATPERPGGIIQPIERREVEDYFTYPFYKFTKEKISEPLAYGAEQTFGRYGIPGQVAVGTSKFLTSLPEFGATVGVGLETVLRKTATGKEKELIGLAGTGLALQYTSLKEGIKERPAETAGQILGMVLLAKAPGITDIKGAIPTEKLFGTGYRSEFQPKVTLLEQKIFGDVKSVKPVTSEMMFGKGDITKQLDSTLQKPQEIKPTVKIVKGEELVTPEVYPLTPEEWYGKATQFEISPEFSRVGVGGARERIALPEDIIKGEAPPRVRVGKETVTNPIKEPEKPTVREVTAEDLVRLEPSREYPRARLPEETLKTKPKPIEIPKEPEVREVDLAKELVKLERPREVPKARLPEETITRPRVEPEVSTVREVKPEELVKLEPTREMPRARLAEETITKPKKVEPEVVKPTVREVTAEQLVKLEPDFTVPIRPEVFPYGRYTELTKVTDVLKTQTEEAVPIPEVKIPKEIPETVKKPKPEIKPKDREKIVKPEYPSGSPFPDVIDRLSRQLEVEAVRPTESKVLPEIPTVRLPRRFPEKLIGEEAKESPKLVVKKDIKAELEKRWAKRELELKSEEKKGGSQVTREGQILLMKKPEMVAKPKPPEVEMVDLSKMEKMRSPLYVVPVIKSEVVQKRVPKYIQRKKSEIMPLTREREVTKEREKLVIVPSHIPHHIPSFVQLPEQMSKEVPIEKYREISLDMPIEIPITRIIPREEQITEIIPKYKQEKVPELIPERIQREAERTVQKPTSEDGARRGKEPKEAYRYKPRESPIFSGAEKLFFKDREGLVSPLGKPKKKVTKTKEKGKRNTKTSKKEFWEF